MGALKSICFHILSSFRSLIIIIMKIIKFLSFLGLVFSIFFNLFQEKVDRLWWISIIYLLFFILSSVLMHYYDVLVLKLKPKDLDITLFK